MKTQECYKQSFDGFSGLDTTSVIGRDRMVQMKNFKLLEDGSVIKRNGYRHLSTLPKTPRGWYGYSDGSAEVILAVVDSGLYRVEVKTGNITFSSVFDTDSGTACFFEMCGVLYIFDGDKIYRYNGGCDAVGIDCYVPLYGKDWNANSRLNLGVNEPINLFSPRVRVTYKTTSETLYSLNLGKKIKSIDAVYINGEFKPTKMFTLNSDRDGVQCSNYTCREGSVVVAYYTLDESELQKEYIMRCKKADVFDCFSYSRVFLYGKEDDGKIIVSHPVDASEVEACYDVYGETEPLYFPESLVLSFGSKDKINRMCRVYDRMVFFCNSRAWITQSLCEKVSVENIKITIDSLCNTCGCGSEDGARMIGGASPVTVGVGGAYMWKIDSELKKELTLKRLSKKISSLFDESFVKNALVCYDQAEDELWFGNAESEDGRVLIYNCSLEEWYMYTGIFADRFFESTEGIVFAKENKLYIFDKSRSYDSTEDEEFEIEAVIRSGGFEFEGSSSNQYLVGGRLLCELDGGSVELAVRDKEPLFFKSFSYDEASDKTTFGDSFDFRTRTPLTKAVSFSISAVGKCRQRIYKLKLDAI